MPMPVFSCELHARVTLAADLQVMQRSALALSDPLRLAEAYGIHPNVAAHIREREIEWRGL